MIFLRKLSLGIELSPEDRATLVGLCTPARRVEPRTDLADEGSPRGGLFLVLSGWACRYRVLADGYRQITGLRFRAIFLSLSASRRRDGPAL